MSVVRSVVRSVPAKQRAGGARGVTRALSSERLGLFSEVVIVSLAVGLLAAPAVTALPALAAGSQHLRRYISGESHAYRTLLRDFWSALRGGWLWALGSAAAFAAAAITLTNPLISVVPGGEPLRWVSAGIAAVGAIVLLRASAQWTPTARWGGLVREAAADATRDLRGSMLLLLALALSAMIVWMFAPLVVLVPGLLLFATRAVLSRADTTR
ncbi:hypothetical protein K0817_016725 [Microbacterium sp. HD4P20]|uniref:hypothetical protein n=1 Tax=Microbacterium sp. HD4P20 TaxID=2864874 RepID=UPI0020A57D6F|nr:hypothetical protein [Microbacterium sp. HD4P20]MCP2638200.1 hypothetical protein [Microbacterium sp. HD4P20]